MTPALVFGVFLLIAMSISIIGLFIIGTHWWKTHQRQLDKENYGDFSFDSLSSHIQTIWLFCWVGLLITSLLFTISMAVYVS